jgi:hypothetical protein
MNMMTFNPKLVMFGIGLAITFVIGTAIGLVDHNQMANAAIARATVRYAD